MHLDALITAADFLCRHSPAGYITPEKNTLLVCGNTDDALADAFFDLLVSTAYKKGVPIRLIRLCPVNAEQKELDFLCDNEERICAFVQTELSMNPAERPLTVQFFDVRDPAWREGSDRIGYAVNLLADGPGIPCDPCFTSGEIERFSPLAGSWSAADEARCAVLRTARKVHKAYTAGWNSRYRESGITDDLYGKKARDENGYYCLRSSLRFAVSIPWKLAAAQVSPGPGAAEALYRKLQASRGAIHSQLAWQEHRSWAAFMVLEGWSAPTVGQMQAYLFKNGNDHRDKENLLHPCLWDLRDDDWFRPHARSLESTPVHQWSEAYRHPDDYCLLDQASLIVHHLCKEIVLSPEYRARMYRLFRTLEAALLRPGQWGSEALIGRLQWMENMFDRLRSNETHSYAPWQNACGQFAEALANGPANVYDDARRVFDELCREAKVAVERNRYSNYKKIDADIIRWLPWIISTDEADTVWKLYAPDNVLENVLSSIILRPRALNLICDEEDLASVPVNTFRDMLSRHGVEDITVTVVPLSSLDGGTVPARDGSVVDVTSCGSMQNRVRIPEGARVIYYGDDDLRDSSQSGFFCPLYHPYDFTMTVHEMLQLRGAEILSGTESNEMLGMESDYEALWLLRREIKHGSGSGTAWKYTIAALQEAESALRKPIYAGDLSVSRPFCYPFSPGQFDAMARTGALSVLYELQSLGCIADLFVDMDHSRLTCRIFPAPAEGDPFGDTEAALTEMLGDPRGESHYAVVDEYLSHGAPRHFVNMSLPVQLDAAAIAERMAARETREGRPGRADLERQITLGIRKLAAGGLLVPAEGLNQYRFKSIAVRRELEKEGFALEAYVYYTLFLSGKFDDIRSNVRIRTGESASGGILEKELDILVTRKGKMGVISCKDTGNFDILHIGELRMQAELYGVNAKPILVCSEAPTEQDVQMCKYIHVGLVTLINRDLPTRIIRILSA